MSGWVYKLCGALAVFLVAWGTDRRLRCASLATEAQIRGYLALFTYLRHGIAYERAPLDELFARCSPSLISACTGKEDTRRVPDLAALLAETEFLSAKLLEMMEEAAAKLGRGYHEEQIAACDKYVDALSLLVEAHQSKREERTRVTSVLLYTASAALVLLLL